LRLASPLSQEGLEVVDITGKNEVVVVGQHRDVAVDNVSRSRGRAEAPDRSRHISVEAVLADASKQTSEKSLARAASSPCLGYTARRCHDSLTPPPGRLDQRGDLAIAAIERDQRPAVEDKAHLAQAAPRRRLLPRSRVASASATSMSVRAP
jgi:hypothetical protein